MTEDTNKALEKLDIAMTELRSQALAFKIFGVGMALVAIMSVIFTIHIRMQCQSINSKLSVWENQRIEQQTDKGVH